MSKLIDNIKRLAALIKGETKSGGNTAARVGGLFEEMAVELENKYDKTETDRLMTQHDTAGNSHLNVQEMLLQKINDVRETLLAADQGITQELTTHAGTKAIHKTSEEIRAEIVEEDIPETLARVDYVEREKAAILELARQYVTQGIAEVVGGAPDVLNALNELAAAINNDPNFAASIMTQLNGKADSVHTHNKSQITDFPSSLPASDVYAWAKQPEKPVYTAAEIGAATRDHNHAGVYQPAGSYAAGTHTHSANEISDTSSKVMMTTSERSKLSGIAAGANNYTHPSTHPASMIAEETNKRFMTDAERSKLSGIAAGANNYTHPSTHPASMITEETNKRFMTDAERSKLSGIAAGANNYTHPSTHPARMIVEETNKRFMTDAERNKLAELKNIFSLTAKRITTSYTISVETYIVVKNTGNITITLPSGANLWVGRFVYIRLLSGTEITLRTSDGKKLIVSSAEYTSISSWMNAWGCALIVWDGINWVFNQMGY